jgi:hypothetical protein
MANEKDKVFTLVSELSKNNRLIGAEQTKIKGLKDAIKAYTERNITIIDELAVHTEEDDF